MYVRFPFSLRNVEDLLHERGFEFGHEKIRFWWNRFGPMFAAEIRRKRVQNMRVYANWRWHLDTCQRRRAKRNAITNGAVTTMANA